EEHELRRVEGAARQAAFARRLQAVILAVLAGVKGARTAVLHCEAGRQRASMDLEVRPLHRREQEPRRGAAATALVNGDVRAAPAFLIGPVMIDLGLVAELVHRLHEARKELVAAN